MHSPLGLLCGCGPRAHFWCNEGVLQEFFPHLWGIDRAKVKLWYYDSNDLAERYATVTAKEPNLTVWSATTL